MPEYKETLVDKVAIDPKRSLLPIRIVGDRALVKYESTGEYLSEKAGIVKPVDYKEPYAKGRVMSIGNGEYGTNIPESLEAGQMMNYWNQSAIPFEFEGVTYDLVRVSDLFMHL